MIHHRKMAKANICSLLLAIFAQSPVMAESVAGSPLQKGYEQLKCKDYSAALTSFNQAVRDNPSDLQARRYLAVALTRSGKPEAAVNQMEMIIRIDPGHAQDLIALADAYFLLGKTKQAVIYYQRTLQLEPKMDIAYVGLAQAYLSLNENSKANLACTNGLNASTDAKVRNQLKSIMDTIRQRECTNQQSTNPG